MSAETDILIEDQQAINRFARLTSERVEFVRQLELIEEQLNSLSDSRDEVELMMGGSVKVLIGETFVELSEDRALERIEASLAKIRAEKESVHGRVEAIDGERKSLKSHLYARFGGNINLEDE